MEQEIRLNLNHTMAKLPATMRANVGVGHRAGEYTARLALDGKTQRDAFALRYRSYLNSGFIEQNLTELFMDRFDNFANSETVVIYQDERPVASIRLCYLSQSQPTTSPARETFPAEVDQLLCQTLPSKHSYEAVELTRLVRCPSAANNQGLVFLLLRVAGYLALQRDFKLILSCVRQHHVAFYKRLRFKAVTDLRPYPGLNCPMQMLTCSRLDYDEARMAFSIIDPDATSAGVLAGLLTGEVVSLTLVQRS